MEEKKVNRRNQLVMVLKHKDFKTNDCKPRKLMPLQDGAKENKKGHSIYSLIQTMWMGELAHLFLKVGKHKKFKRSWNKSTQKDLMKVILPA